MKRTMFTSFTQKREWLLEQIGYKQREIHQSESAGQWAKADAAYDEQTKLLRELNVLEDDMML